MPIASLTWYSSGIFHEAARDMATGNGVLKIVAPRDDPVALRDGIPNRLLKFPELIFGNINAICSGH